MAFLSLEVQIDGLIGSSGILPVEPYLTAVWEKLGIVGYWTYPTLCWFNATDTFLHFLSVGGAFLSLLLIAGVCPIPSLIALWMFYLSLSTVARTFLGFQWDTLLLEVGFLAIFLAPNQWFPRFSRERLPSRIAIWLCFWLLFRLMFSAGLVKLTSGDLSWRHLTALNYHYETQPIPNALSWYAHQIPENWQKISVACVFIIEILSPFLIFGPRRLRLVAFFAINFLMVLIISTGNYCFFNLLAIALSVLLLDDEYWKRILPMRWFKFPPTAVRSSLTNFIAAIIVAALVIPLSVIQMKPRVFRLKLSDIEKRLYSWTAPYRTVNGYGLFANMTESRPEIIIQGSDNRKDWRDYAFKWKPGDLQRLPSQVAPHQPRVDWQMWFEALNYQRGGKPTEWFRGFLVALLSGRGPVLDLLEHNPFTKAPPEYIRAIVYDYRFTDRAEKESTGNWWKREYTGVYVYPSSLPKEK